MTFTPRLVVVVGTPGSGKDLLIQGVNDLGTQHAQIVPKHTSRKRNPNDSNEMICSDDPNCDLENCDLVYENFGDSYGIKCNLVWEGLQGGSFQVVVISNVEAINRLREIFGQLLMLIYVHSELSADEYLQSEKSTSGMTEYVKKRVEGYRIAFDLYLEHYLAFEHVLIYSGVPEDLYDQIFRLFNAYENGVI